MPTVHPAQREVQRPVDHPISFRNPFAYRLAIPPHRRTRKPFLQLQRGLPHRASLQPCHQLQYVPARPTRKAVKDLPLHVHVKSLDPVALVNWAPSSIPAVGPSFELVHLVTPQHCFQTHALFERHKAHLLTGHAASFPLWL